MSQPASVAPQQALKILFPKFPAPTHYGFPQQLRLFTNQRIHKVKKYTEAAAPKSIYNFAFSSLMHFHDYTVVS